MRGVYKGYLDKTDYRDIVPEYASLIFFLLAIKTSPIIETKPKKGE